MQQFVTALAVLLRRAKSSWRRASTAALMKIAILAYDRMTALDAVGPYEIVCRIPDAMVHFVAEAPGPLRTDTHGSHSRFALVADARLEGNF